MSHKCLINPVGYLYLCLFLNLFVWLDYFKIPVFKFKNSFLCLTKFVIDTVSHIFCFIYWIFQLQDFWDFYNIYLCWISHSEDEFFPISLNYWSVFSCSSMSFLRSFFWIPFQEFCTFYFCGGLLLENYCVLLEVFFCFFIFLVPLCWYLCI